MATLVRLFANANFSDSVILDIEPAISWPTATLAAHRLRSSLSFSGTKKAGTWTAPLVEAGSGTAIDYEGAYVDYEGGIQLALQDQLMPSGSVTIVTVDYVSQIGAAGAQWLGGANGYGLRRDTSDMTTVFRAGGADAVSLDDAGTERWEMTFGVYNDSTKAISIYRPRDSGTASATLTAAPSIPVTAIRLAGNVGAVAARGALKAFVGAAMSTSEMDSLYASAKASLAISGISI